MLGAGCTIGREFVIERPLGSGGMGAVFVALQKSTRVRRALKLMRPEIVRDSRLRERFIQEARISGSIPSDHVVQVITAGIDEDTATPFLVMELLEGEDLATAVRQRGHFDTKALAAVFEELCHAVGAAHRTGIVHRDLKPENIFLARARTVGAPFVVKVLDFGIAKIVAEARAHTTEPMGTPLWMAPEQTARGASVSPQTDVWALGLIAFFCLTGHVYWGSAEEEHVSVERILREMLVDELVPPSRRATELGLRLPGWFDGWFGQCVHRDPTARFSDAATLWDALGRCLLGETVASATELMPSSPIHMAAAPGVAPTVPWERDRDAARANPLAAVPRTVPAQDDVPSGARAAAPTALVATSGARQRVTWLLAGLALTAGGLVVRQSIVSSSSPTPQATTSSAAAAAPAMPEAPNIESRVHAWNAAHAAKDEKAFTSLYAETVLYYGSQQSRDACVSSKRAFLAKNADFRQEVFGEIRTTRQGNSARADFLKRVVFHGKTTDYPSYLAFKNSSEGWKIVTEGDTVTDANLAKKEAKVAPQNTITGDFEGDGVPESVSLIPPPLPATQTEENFGDCVGKCDCRLVFSNSKLPPITVENCIGGAPVNEGDLNEDGGDEIGLLPEWWTSCWRGYRVYTLRAGLWKPLVASIRTHCNQWDKGVDAIERDPNRPGYVITRSTEMSTFAVQTESIRVR